MSGNLAIVPQTIIMPSRREVDTKATGSAAGPREVNNLLHTLRYAIHDFRIDDVRLISSVVEASNSGTRKTFAGPKRISHPPPPTATTTPPSRSQSSTASRTACAGTPLAMQGDLLPLHQYRSSATATSSMTFPEAPSQVRPLREAGVGSSGPRLGTKPSWQRTTPC